MKNLLFKLFILIILPVNIYAQVRIENKGTDIPKQKWVDNVFNSLTIEERIAQLIVIRSYSDMDSNYYDTIAKHIAKYDIGGVCFFKGSPTSQVGITNYYQKLKGYFHEKCILVYDSCFYSLFLFKKRN